jgi:hypothetical protein
VTARGEVEAWLDGVPMKAEKGGRFVAVKPARQAATVTLRVLPAQAGLSGGALIPDPVAVETDGSGVMSLGDWSKAGILNNYSGGVRYRTKLTLTPGEAKAKGTLDLGRVAGTAEIWVNGKKAGVRVAPPWRQEVSGFLKKGENTFEVLVYNTLANHYQTIPSRYRGDPLSGLLGPVRLVSREWPESSGEVAAATAASVGESEEQAGLRYTYASGAGTLAADNLLKDAALFKASGKAGHPGGGRDFTALFNGQVLNGAGTEVSENDGRTFVGFGEGDALTLAFEKAVTLSGACTVACHQDARASQRYEIWAAPAAAPERFEKLAAVDRTAESGLNRVDLGRADGKPLAQKVVAVRFVFKNGPAGFNVYREIALLGSVEK